MKTNLTNGKATRAGLSRALLFILFGLSAVAGLIGYPLVVGWLAWPYHPRDHFIVALLVVIGAGGFLYGRACRQAGPH